MHSLSGQELLSIWEVGREQHPIDQALTILLVACQGMSRSALAALRLGQRDTLLYAVRAQTFGEQLAGLANCPACDQPMEFTLNLADMAMAQPDALEPGCAEQQFQIEADGYELTFRLPTSLDLAALISLESLDDRCSLLVQRCVAHAAQGGVEVAPASLPAPTVQTLAAAMATHDPLADAELDLTCAACGQSWQVVFDIGAFLWAEIAAQARRLLRDVHVLAQAYGWREADILALSAARRQFYLEMVS